MNDENDEIREGLENSNEEVEQLADWAGEKVKGGAKQVGKKALKAAGKLAKKAVQAAAKAAAKAAQAIGKLFMATLPWSAIILGILILIGLVYFFITSKLEPVVAVREAIEENLSGMWNGITDRHLYEDEIDTWNSSTDPDKTSRVYQSMLDHKGDGDAETSVSADLLGTVDQTKWQFAFNKENDYLTQENSISILKRCVDYNNEMFRFFNQYYEYKQWIQVKEHYPGTSMVSKTKLKETFPNENTKGDGKFAKESRIHIEGEERDGKRLFAVHWQDLYALLCIYSENKLTEAHDWSKITYKDDSYQVDTIDPEIYITENEIKRVFDLFKYEFKYHYGTDADLRNHDMPTTQFQYRTTVGPNLESGGYTLGYRYKRLADPVETTFEGDYNYPGELPYTMFVPEQAPDVISNSFEMYKYIYVDTHSIPNYQPYYTPDKDVYDPPSGGYCIGRWHIVCPKDFIEGFDTLDPYFRDLSYGNNGAVRAKYGYDWVSDLMLEYGDYLNELPFTDATTQGGQSRADFFKELGELYSKKIIRVTYEGTTYGDAAMNQFLADLAAIYPGWTVKWDKTHSNMTSSYYPPFEDPPDHTYPFWSYGVTFHDAGSFDVEESQKVDPKEIEERDYQDAKVPIHNFNGTENEFLQEIKDIVIEDMKKTGILASITAAQALIESKHGVSGLTKKANNLFGIKGQYNGNSVWMNTREEVGGRSITVKAEFRAYQSWAESIADHSRLLSNSRYQLSGEKDYVTAAHRLKDKGYATDSRYASTLISVIKAYHLDEWDKAGGSGSIKRFMGINYARVEAVPIRKEDYFARDEVAA